MTASMTAAPPRPVIGIYLDGWAWLDNCDRQTMHPTHEHVADEFGINRAELANALAGHPVEPEFIVHAIAGFTDVPFDELFVVAFMAPN